MKKIKELFGSMQSKHGTYSAGIIVVVAAIIIVVNMIAGKLPENVRSIDISSSKIYDITKTSRKLLKNLDKEVNFYVFADKESADERIKTFLHKYAGLSDRIKVKWIDPVLHPSELTKYDTQADTIVVECKETNKTRTVSFTDMIEYDTSSYYSTGNMTETGFDAEGQLTSAVNSVTSEKTGKIYRVTGHGETTFSTSVTEMIEKANLTISELNLIMKNEIPKDCELLFFYAPTSDITSDEKKLLETYMKSGGKVFIILGETEKETPNLDAFMKTYGMQKVDGYIADTTRCYQGNYYYIFPELSVSGEMAEGLSSEMVMLVNSLGMEVNDPERDTITTSGFMETSSDGHAVTEDGETKGTYTLGAVATETLEDDKESRLTVISSATMIDENLTEMFSTLENTTLFMNAVTANFEEISNVSIEPKSLEVEYNTMKYAGVSSLVVVFGIPAAVVLFGLVKWLKRRKA